MCSFQLLYLAETLHDASMAPETFDIANFHFAIAAWTCQSQVLCEVGGRHSQSSGQWALALWTGVHTIEFGGSQGVAHLGTQFPGEAF